MRRQRQFHVQRIPADHGDVEQERVLNTSSIGGLGEVIGAVSANEAEYVGYIRPDRRPVHVLDRDFFEHGRRVQWRRRV